MALTLNKNYQSLLIFPAAVVGLAFLVWVVMHNDAIVNLFSPAASVTEVVLGETHIPVEVVSSAKDVEHGLSERENLPAGQGMLFVFGNDGNWGIWMKDMRFSIDIIWADSAGRVVTVLPSVSPETYPKAFYPSLPARYVLEVPAGFAAANHFSEGMRMVLSSAEN